MALTEGRAVGVLGELLERGEILEAAAISTCNRTELYLYAADPVGAEAAALGLLSREADTQPTELVGSLYSLRGGGGRRAALPRHRGPRLDDHRRGRGPGPGQARLRAGPGRGRDRAGAQPAVPRRARRGQAGPNRDRASRERALSIPSVAVELAQRTLGELEDRRVLRRRRRRDRRAHRPRARRQGRRGDLHRQPPLRPRDRPRRSASAASAVRFEELPEELAGADIVVASTSSPHHVIEREALAEVMEARDGRPAAADRPRGAARHPPGCRDIDGVSLYDMDDLQALVERNVSGREAEARRAEAMLRAELARFERWLGGPGRDDRRSPRCTRAPTRSSRGCSPRTSRAGRASREADRERLRRWRERSPRGCCTSRPCGSSATPASDDAYV